MKIFEGWRIHGRMDTKLENFDTYLILEREGRETRDKKIKKNKKCTSLFTLYPVALSFLGRWGWKNITLNDFSQLTKPFLPCMTINGFVKLRLISCSLSFISFLVFYVFAAFCKTFSQRFKFVTAFSFYKGQN